MGDEPAKYPDAAQDGSARAGSSPGAPASGTGKLLFGLVVGLIVGAGTTGAAVWTMMPRMMLVVHESKYGDVEETSARLQAAIEANGWSSPAIRDMNASMAKHGVEFPSPVRVVELCNAQYAHDVLETNPEVTTLMPCAFGVYEGPDGKVYISGMNMGLMGKMFGGRIAEVMGSRVAQDEAKILGQVAVE